MKRALTRRTTIPEEVRIYHITHIGNLQSIIQKGELLSFHGMQESGIAPRSIAFDHLRQRRETTEIRVGPRGTLHDYVPWGFAARSPMLYTIARGGLPGPPVKQEEIVHLVTTVGRIIGNDLSFVFSDGHPLSEFSEFYDDVQELPPLLDWDILTSDRWNNTPADPDRKRRRQGEFLVQNSVPWNLVGVIGVRTEATANGVKKLFPDDSPIKVIVLPEWYYTI